MDDFSLQKIKEFGLEKVCLVTKGRSIKQIEKVLQEYPKIKIIAENKYPDCLETFSYFSNYEKHFIGRIQSNKIKKIVEVSDCIQSVSSLKKLEKISTYAKYYKKKIKLFIQVNVSNDPNKGGLSSIDLADFLNKSNSLDLEYVSIEGLMTILKKGNDSQNYQSFKILKKHLDQINSSKILPKSLSQISMGMSSDFKEAIKAGSNLLRLGSIFFNN